MLKTLYAPLDQFIFPGSDYIDEEYMNNIIWLPPTIRIPYSIPAACINVSPNRPWVIMMHGNAENITGGSINIAHDWNVNMLLIEYPGYGLSPGSPTAVEINAHCEIALHFLTNTIGVPLKNIILAGRSIGTGPACKLAAKYEIGGLILISAYSTICDIIANFIGWPAHMLFWERWDNKQAIETVVCPTLFIHGAKDTLIPCTHSKLLHQLSPAKIKIIRLLENADHNAGIHNNLFADAIDQIIDNACPNRPLSQINIAKYKTAVINKNTLSLCSS